MQKVSYRRHRFHPDIMRQAVWLYFRFTMSYRDVEDLLAERGIDVSYETVRLWALKFGQAYARRIRKRRDPAYDVWHLDEVFVNIGGKKMYLWRAVDGEGEVFDVLVQTRRNKQAALKLMRKILRNQGVQPIKIVVDKMKSYGAAFRDLRLSHLHETGHRLNNRAESSHVPIRRRERKLQRYKSQKLAQNFLSIYGPIYNLFNVQRHLISRNIFRSFRDQAMAEWHTATMVAQTALAQNFGWHTQIKLTDPSHDKYRCRAHGEDLRPAATTRESKYTSSRLGG